MPNLFHKLSLSGFDESTLSQEQWQAIIREIPSELLELRVSTVASGLGLKWPRQSEKWASFTIRESRVGSPADLLEMQFLGKGRFRTIVLCVVHVSENSADYLDAGQSDVRNHQCLSISGVGWWAFGSSHWASIIESIPFEAYQTAIRTVAHDLGLKWPATGWDDFSVHDCLISSFQDLASQKGMGKVKMRTIVHALAHLAGMSEVSEAVESSENIWTHPVIQGIDGRERAVFERRILRLNSKSTLEEIGAEYSVSRERIRQIEKLILKRIRSSGLFDRLSSMLEDYKKNIILPDPSAPDYLLLTDMESFFSALPNEVALAIALENETVFSWLSTFAVEKRRGWYFGTRSEFEALDKSVNLIPAEILPITINLASSISGLSEDDLIPFIKLTQSAATFHGYLIPYRTGRAHAMRAVMVYNHALSQDRRFWTFNDLVEGAVGTKDRFNVRNHRLSIRSTDRMFITTSGYAVCLGHGQSCSPVRSRIEGNGNVRREVGAQSDNHDVISELLTEEWPITSRNVSRLFQRRFKDHNISDSSIITSIASDPYACRLAPGVYAPLDYIDDPSRLERARRLSLSERELRNYCFAKRSGEATQDLFPLWDYDQEQRWYRKIQKREGDVLLGTLVSVARQDQWPEQCNREKLGLLELGVSAKFGIGPYWLSERSYRGPDLSETLVVMRYAYEVSSISWIRANYILGSRQITDEAGITAVILGIALGLLDDSKRPWWEPVPASQNFVEVWESIERLFLQRDLPSWDHPAIKYTLRDSLAKAENGKLAFVSPGSLRMILNELKSQPEVSTQSTIYV